MKVIKRNSRKTLLY